MFEQAATWNYTKLHRDTKRVSNYTENNFQWSESNLDNLQYTMEVIQPAQTCDHRKKGNLFVWFSNRECNQRQLETNTIHSDLQYSTLFKEDQKTKFAKSLGVLANGKTPAKLKFYLDLQELLSSLKISGKQLSILPKHSTLYYCLSLVKNVYVNNDWTPDQCDDSRVQWRDYSQRLQGNRASATHHKFYNGSNNENRLELNSFVKKQKNYAEMNIEEYIS